MADGALIVDSELDLAGAVAGTAAPPEVIAALCLIRVHYGNFDGRRHRGQLVVHRELAAELEELFAVMETQAFPISGAVPIIRFGWSDEASMAADNTSAFNYRTITGTDRLSMHATGRAIDINPKRNPAFYPDGRVAPVGGLYLPDAPGTFTGDHPVVRAFLKRGWRWGGQFRHIRDYHHFEK